MLATFILSLLVGGAGNSAPADSFAKSLQLYEGTWQVTSKNSTKPDILVNDCAFVGKYFACQQTINGSPGALLVFIPAGGPGRFYTQNITAQGRATGRDDLEISGNQWTYTSRRDQNGATTFFRTTNTFSGTNRIHFEQSESTNGTDWTVKNSGDEVRLPRSGSKPGTADRK